MSIDKVNKFDYLIDENRLEEYNIAIKDYCLINGNLYMLIFTFKFIHLF
jgi:hypothetical protein